jgi:enoyl-[acyl-carrier protein] reductase III
MQKTLAGKVALVTGGSRGIGKAISIALAQQGCSVALNYLSDHESAEETAHTIRTLGVEALLLQSHIGNQDSRNELWSKFEERFDCLDYLVVNAATGVFREATKLTLNSVRKVFAVNFEALIDLAHEGVRRMRSVGAPYGPGERGRIIALSSIGAERVIANYGSIGASKAAMEAMTRQLAYELGGEGINCNVVRAGLVDTGVLNYLAGKDRIIEDTIARTPNGRLVRPEDVADLVVFLVSQNAKMINGQTLMVDGGYGLMA